jgi:phosphatidylinositol glycan class B
LSLAAWVVQRSPRITNRRQLVIIFAVIVAIGAALRCWSAAGGSIIHPDEVFQYEEPAHKLAFGYGVITWEWREGIRSWVLPSLLAVVMKLVSYLACGSLTYIVAIRFLCSIGSLSAIWFAFAWTRTRANDRAALLAAGIVATWCQMVTYASHPLSEVIAANFLLPGLYLLVWCTKRRALPLIGGVMLGIAVGFRFQLVPVVVTCLLVMLYKRGKRVAGLALLGILLSLFVFDMVDLLSLGTFAQSEWKYLAVNLIQGASRRYGVSPWWWYVQTLFRNFTILLVPIVIGACADGILSLLCLVTIGAFSVIAHKEERFLYPVIPLLLVMAAIGIERAVSYFERSRQQSVSLLSFLMYSLGFVIACSIALQAASDPWPDSKGATGAMDSLAIRRDVCGVGLREVPWYSTGGYTHLHRDIPLIILQADASPSNDWTMVNAVIQPAELGGLPSTFVEQSCADDICVYERSGSCTTVRAGADINSFLRDTGN